MKLKIAVLSACLALLIASVFCGCSSTSKTSLDTAADTASETETTETEASDSETSETEDASDIETYDNGQDVMEYIDSMYTFYYPSADFTSAENGDHSCTVSYINESVQTAGSNVISISVETGTTYDAVLAEKMEALGVTDYEVTESNFGADGIEAYSASTGALSAEGSELTTSETIFAIPDGEDVVVIDVFRTIGTDDGAETAVDDAISSVLDTFYLMDR